MSRARSSDRSIKDDFEKALLQYISVMVMVTAFAIVFAACQPISATNSPVSEEKTLQSWVAPESTGHAPETQD